MDEKLFTDRMKKFDIACRQLDTIPETMFARGIKDGRKVLVMMSGPSLTQENIEEIRLCLVEKEKTLK